MIALSNQLHFIGTYRLDVCARTALAQVESQKIWKMNYKWTWDVSGVYSK